MANTDYKSVDEYLTKQPPAARKVLQQVRGIIRKALPAADEVISYQIAAYKLRGSTLIYLAGWKEHYSIYPATAGVMAAFAKELGPHRVSKGTLRFALSEPIPTKLIAGIAKVRAKEAEQARLAKTTAKAVKKKPDTKPKKKPSKKPKKKTKAAPHAS